MAKLLSLRNFFPREAKTGFKHKHFFNSLPKQKLQEILLYSESDYIASLFPKIQKKNVILFNDQRHKYLLARILANDPEFLLNYIYRGEAPDKQKQGYFSILGDIKKPALRRGAYDVVFCPFVLESYMFVEDFIKTVNPFLGNGSRLVLSVIHPQIENMLFNQNPAEHRVAEGLTSRYFRLFRDNHFFTEDLQESCVDLALKPFFTQMDADPYHDYKNTPVCLFFKVVKFQKEKKKL